MTKGRQGLKLGLVCALALGLAACAAASATEPPLPPPAVSATPAAVLAAAETLAAPARLATTTPEPPPVSAPPLPSPSAPPPAPSPVAPTASPEAPTIRLLFTGDINPGRCPAQVSLTANDFTLPYQAVAETLRSADITVGSLDGTISDLATPAPCSQSMNLIGPARTVEGLRYAGFDVITVATNHALDCGGLGWRCKGQSLQDTRRNLLAAGLQPVGLGNTLTEARAPVIVERQGIRFAFLGVNAISGQATWAAEASPGTAPLSAQSLAEVTADIASARAQADVVIVLPHWGVEYQALPDADQRAWAAQMVAAGADLVIGNHPHVAQPVETLAGGQVVAYALGNFVFDQDPKPTRQGLVFEAVFQGARLQRWKLLPVHIYDLYQPRWANSAEAASILSRLTAAAQSRR